MTDHTLLERILLPLAPPAIRISQEVGTIIQAKFKLVVTCAFGANDKIKCGLVSGSVVSYPKCCATHNRQL